jgi:arsenate reductase (glutaredoxin)
MELWHNPRCSKSRAAKALLDDEGVGYVERRYLDEPPTAAELREVLAMLGLEPWDLVRHGEQTARDLGLADWPRQDPDRWIEAMVANPVLIERPIVVTDDGRAAVGRPLDRIAELLPGG